MAAVTPSTSKHDPKLPLLSFVRLTLACFYLYIAELLVYIFVSSPYKCSTTLLKIVLDATEDRSPLHLRIRRWPFRVCCSTTVEKAHGGKFWWAYWRLTTLLCTIKCTKVLKYPQSPFRALCFNLHSSVCGSTCC